MVVSHGYLKNRLPYPHMQQYVPGVAACFLEPDVVLFEPNEDGSTTISITTNDAGLAGKIMSWYPVEGPGAAQVELLRSYVLYPGLTLTETDERALVSDYIKHYYDIGLIRYSKNKAAQHSVFMQAIGMVCTVTNSQNTHVNIMNMLISSTKYVHMYVKSTDQNIALANYADWFMVRLMAHAILRYVWSYGYSALSDLIPRGLFRTSKGAKPTVNGAPIESVVYNEYSRTITGSNMWHNDSTRDAFMVRTSEEGAESEEGTAVWYDDRGRKYHLVVTTTTKPNENGVIENSEDTVENVAWVYDEKEDPSCRVVCDDVMILKFVGPFNNQGMKYSIIDRSATAAAAAAAATATAATGTAVVPVPQQPQPVTTVVAAAAATEAQPQPTPTPPPPPSTLSEDIMLADAPAAPAPPIVPSVVYHSDNKEANAAATLHLSLKGDDLIIKDPMEQEMLTMYERDLIAKGAYILAQLDAHASVVGEVSDTIRNGCARVREYVRLLGATDTTYGHTIWLARIGPWVVDGNVYTVHEDIIKHAYGALQKAVLRIIQHNPTAYKARKVREHMLGESMNAIMQSDGGVADLTEAINAATTTVGGDRQEDEDKKKKNSTTSLYMAASILGAGLVSVGVGCYFGGVYDIDVRSSGGGKMINIAKTQRRTTPYRFPPKNI